MGSTLPPWPSAPECLAFVVFTVRGRVPTRSFVVTVLSCSSPHVQSLTRSSWLVAACLSSNGLRTCLNRASYPGVSCSSTLTEADSDLHLICLTRLCCVFRLSQPLDALFRPRPLRPCFVPVAPLSFYLQRFPLFVCGRHLSVPPSPLAVCSVDESMKCSSRGLRIQRVRSD